MRAPIVSMPGKVGDLIYSVAVIREIVALYGSRVHLLTSAQVGAVAVELIAAQDLTESINVDPNYVPTGMEPGMQPWRMDVPEDLELEPGHRDVLHIGLRRYPLPGESIADAMAASYGLKVKPGPWLNPVTTDPAGPVILHAPVTAPGFKDVAVPWSHLVQHIKAKLRKMVFIGTPAECMAYRQSGVEQIPGAEVRPCQTLAEMAIAMIGASSFAGVASAPAVVAAGVGLPCVWALRPGVDARWVPHGCDVSLFERRRATA